MEEELVTQGKPQEDTEENQEEQKLTLGPTSPAVLVLLSNWRWGLATGNN
jgi:hypothetical protein